MKSLGPKVMRIAVKMINEPAFAYSGPMPINRTFNNWIKTTTYIKVVVMMFNRINAGRHSRLNTINETY